MKFHKKFHVVALLAAILALNAQAAEVSSVQVKRAVSAWAAANGSAFANPGSVTGATPVEDSDGTVLYWIVKMSNGGVVIASPDTDLDLVIAVLEKSDGTFPAGHPLPSILKKDMKNRLSIIRSGSASSSSSGNSGVRMASMLNATTQSTAANLPEDVKASVLKANAQWEKYGNPNAGVSLLGASLTDGDASPYVRNIVTGFETGGRYTHWNQGNRDGKPLYNLNTPNNEVCGCVATAGAALMQFFGENSLGKKHEIKAVASTLDTGCTLYGQKYDCKTIPGEIDWAASQLPNYSASGTFATELTEEQRQLLGQITYNMGVLVGMSWASTGPGGESGAYLTQLDDALKAYGFKSARYVSFAEGDTDTAQYRKTVFAQNWAGAPVALGISSDEGGHAVIACGYAKDADDDEFCRVFMGWGGSGDSWYNFPEIRSYDVIDDAVTMIGFETDSVVPVCGRANVTNITLTIPNGAYVVTPPEEEGGDPTVEPGPLSVLVNENGYFAVRVPLSMTSPVIEYENEVTEVDVNGEERIVTNLIQMAVTPFDSKALGKEEDLAKLEAATPAEMMFLVLNMTVKSTVASAREVALRDNKALLMVSGAGSLREEALIDYITYLDGSEDLASKFVFVRVNSSDASSIDGDGDPSIGVFDPADGSADLRWWEANGRLAYDNFIDYDADNLEGDSVKYTFSVDDTTALTNTVADVLSKGYDQYLRIHSGITVSVVSAGETVDAPVTPAFGVHEKCWFNEQDVAFSAPSVYTNESAGIVYECLGWSTNGLASVSNVVKGCSTNIVLQAGRSVAFSWLWKVKAYRVTTAVENGKGGDGAVTPSELWRAPGDRATVVADFRGFDGWTVVSTVTKADLDFDEIDACMNGGALSFTVKEPVAVEAGYRDGNSAPSAPVGYSVAVSVNPSEIAELINSEASLALGENSTYDSKASFAAYDMEVVDSTGGVWRCTGWVQDGVTNSVSDLADLALASQNNIELVWEFQEPVPEIIILDPVPVSIGGVSHADGKFSITIPGVKKGWKYYLYSSSNLSDLSGDSSTWPKDESVGANPQEAAEDGNLVFQSTPSGGSMFWRAMEQEIRK